jgi:HEAT repeat protein
VPLLLLLVLLAGVAADPRAQAQAAAALPTDLKSNIANLSSLDYQTRMHAARLIRRTPEAEAVPALSEAARRHANEFVRYRALVLLTAFSNDRGTRELMRDLIRDRNDRVREVAYRWLERHPDPQLAQWLLASLQTEQSEFVRPALVSALAALGSEPAVQRAMMGEIPGGLDFFRSAVIDALGRHRAAYAVDGIVATSRLEGPLQDDAVLALGRIGGTRATTAINEFTNGTPEATQMMHAVRCLLGDMCAEHIKALVAAASADEARASTVRGSIDALEAVAQNRTEAALAALLTLAQKSELRERVAVAFSSVALRQPDWVVERIAAADEATRETAIGMLKDGFDSLEEDFDEEQFFAAVRAGYWRAAEGASARTLAATLIERLEF